MSMIHLVYWSVLFNLSAPGYTKEFYVTPAPAPNPDCPKDKPCHTLNEYALNFDQYFANVTKISFLFVNGDSEYFLNENLTITGKVEITLDTVNQYDIASVTVDQKCSFLFADVTNIHLANLVIDTDCCGSETKPGLQVTNAGMFAGQNIAINSKTYLSDIPLIKLQGSLFTHDILEINMTGNSKLADPMLNIAGCELRQVVIGVYNTQTFVFVLKNHTNLMPISMIGTGFVISLKNSTLVMNVYNSDISNHANTGISANVTSGSYFWAYFRNVRFQYNPIGLDIQILTSNFNIVFDECKFITNGLVAVRLKRVQQSIEALEIGMCKCHNTTQSNKTFSIKMTRSIVSGSNIGLQITGMVETTIEDSQIVENTGIGIRQTYGAIYMVGNNLFANNTGHQGVALSLINSQLCLTNNSITIFNQNSANDVGGAIFVQPLILPLMPAECFYQVPTVDNIQKLYIKLQFINNKAEKGGVNIYGIALHDTCIIDRPKNRSPTQSVEVIKQFFGFETSSNLSLISSSPKRVCLCNHEGTPECANSDYIWYDAGDFHAGEKLTLAAVVVGDEFGALASPVFATTKDLIIGTSEAVQAGKYPKCTNVIYSIHPPSNSDELAPTLKLMPSEKSDNSNIESTDIDNAIRIYNESKLIQENLLTMPVFVYLSILHCPLGFALSGAPPSCDCTPFFRDHGITRCSVQHHTKGIYRTATQWIGKLEVNHTNVTTISQYCPSTYCKTAKLAVDIENPDVQCENGRTGLLCGGCVGNLSKVFGSTYCMF